VRGAMTTCEPRVMYLHLVGCAATLLTLHITAAFIRATLTITRKRKANLRLFARHFANYDSIPLMERGKAPAPRLGC
jgi:hypothetical protein